MERRSMKRRIIPVRATRAKIRRTSDEDDDVSLSDTMKIIGSEEGPSSLHVSDNNPMILEKEKEKEKEKGKGKAATEVSESDSEDVDSSDDELVLEDFTTDESDSSDSDHYVRRAKKIVWKKENTKKGEKKKEAPPPPPPPPVEVRIGHLEQAVIDNRARPQMKYKKHRGRKGEDRAALLWEIWEDENELWVNDNLTTEDIDLVSQDEVMEATEPSSDLLMPLLRYQKEWLYWALKQEESVNRGGILADEMGMGKTIQAIALVLARRAICQTGCGTSGSSHSRGLSPQVKCTTLVVCPLVAVIQWVNEIARFTAEGSTKVLVYHGSNRIKNVDQFSEYDFVLTTYSTIEADYRMNMMAPKEACILCGKMYYPNRMAIHRRYFCGPNAVRTAKQSKQFKKGGANGSKYSNMTDAAVEVKHSEHEKRKVEKARKKTKGNLKKIPGINSHKCTQTSADRGSSAKKSVLHSVKWNRIILDEAHYIKDRRSNTARAVLALESSYKWALSGTPLQNRVGELYSLVRFLQVTPYSYYFCKDCDCKSLDYSSSSQCSSCVHSSVRHFCWWNKFVAKPIQSSGNANEGRRAMILLKQKLLKSIVLRRTKKGRAADLALPPRMVTLRRDTLDIKEEDYYESLHSESQLQFNTYVESGTLMNNYAHIFDLLTRLRQAVDHPYLVIHSNAAALKNESNGNISEQECGICHDPAEDPIVASCTHVFCKACLTDYSAALGQVSCPTCLKPLTADFTSKISVGDQGTKTTVKGFRCSSILNRISLDDFQTSTKIDALREEIRFMIERDGSAKAIVFSQFTSFLDLIHYSLQKSGINCVQLVGSMTMGARDVAIQKFTNEPDCKIFLMSLKAGGVALNLTVASQVFLMDPWWNPAVERQAQDRIHRIGQYKPIRIVRFVIENTIEERILKLQEKKELVFEGTVGGSAEALVKLTEADLRFLFAS